MWQLLAENEQQKSPSPKEYDLQFATVLTISYWSTLDPFQGFPGGSNDKESACNAGDLGLIPELGRSPGEGNGNPLQYSCPENSVESLMGYTVHGIAKSQAQLSNNHLDPSQ